MDKKVLLITNNFPPPVNGGSMRVYKFTKYLLRHGYDVYVLCNAHNVLAEIKKDTKLFSEIGEAKYISVPSIGRTKNSCTSNLTNTSHSSVELVSKVKKFILNTLERWTVPDLMRYRWNDRALKEAKKIIKQYNIKNVVTSSPPHSTQLIGLFLKRELNEKINWIVDFRDLWSLSHVFELNLKKNKYANNFVEKKILNACDSVVFVSDSIKKHTVESYKNINIFQKSYVITNGFDSEDYSYYNDDKLEKVTFSYVGTILGPQIKNELLKGIKLFLKYNTNNIRFNFVGEFDTEYKKELGEIQIAEVSSSVTHGEALEIMSSSTFLILILTNTFEGKIGFTGKFFEYLKIGKPILALVPDGEVSMIINKYNLGVVANPDSPEQIAEAIYKLYSEQEKWSKQKIPDEVLEKFSRENLTKQLESLFI